MAEDIARKTCTPCRGGVPPLTREEAAAYLPQTPGWKLLDDWHKLRREFKFADFRASLDFIDKVGRLAEDEGHHPDICFGWGRAEITIWTHKIDGLTESDFVLAAKIDGL